MRLDYEPPVFGVHDKVKRHVGLQHALHVERALRTLPLHRLLVVTAPIELTHMLFPKRVS